MMKRMKGEEIITNHPQNTNGRKNKTKNEEKDSGTNITTLKHELVQVQ